MGFFSEMRALAADVGAATGLTDLKNSLKTKMQRYLNDDFAEASMALLAWVTMADGEVDAAEVETVVRFIDGDETLSIFDSSDLQARFRKHVKALQEDDMFGLVNVKKAISKYKGDAEAASTLLTVGVYLGGSDGDFDESEQEVIRKAALLLGEDPEVYL